MCKSSATPVKFFITSRPQREILQYFDETFYVIDIPNARTNKDVGRWASQSVRKLASLRKIKDDGILLLVMYEKPYSYEPG